MASRLSAYYANYLSDDNRRIEDIEDISEELITKIREIFIE